MKLEVVVSDCFFSMSKAKAEQKPLSQRGANGLTKHNKHPFSSIAAFVLLKIARLAVETLLDPLGFRSFFLGGDRYSTHFLFYLSL